MREHGGGVGHFRVAELLPAVLGAGRTSQAAGQAGAEHPQVVCDRGHRADEWRPGPARQGDSHRGKAGPGAEPKAKRQGIRAGAREMLVVR